MLKGLGWEEGVIFDIFVFNLQSGDPSIKEEELLGMDVDGVCDTDELIGNSSLVKGMLVDLLERKVHKETANGVVDREIRISDKGLELIQNQNPNSQPSPVLEEGQNMNDTLGNEPTGQIQEEPQKMTFYASPEVNFRINYCIFSTSELWFCIHSFSLELIYFAGIFRLLHEHEPY